VASDDGHDRRQRPAVPLTQPELGARRALGQDLDKYVPTFQGQDGALSPTEYPVNS